MAVGEVRWPSSDTPVRRVSDVIHSSIALPSPLDVIVDTPEFQRLRYIKQLGVAHLVFPCANHTRFTHCIGACHIAQLFLSSLRQNESLRITGEDALCVAIGALCHDIGHGPFSHTYDGPFLEEVGRKGQWTHEMGSKALLKRVLAIPRVEAAVRPFLASRGEEEYQRNLTFIEELISPPAKLVDEEGAWIPRGRPREKSFLYDIVSNVHDGFDVDKFDYILRDALLTGVGIRFNGEGLLRLVHNVRVLPCPRLGIRRICFAKKVAEELLALADSRYTLHARVYQHHTVRLLDTLTVKVFVAAEPHFTLSNAKGERFSLSTMMNDLDVFCGVDDSVLRQIAHSFDPSLQKARDLLLSIEERRLAQRIALFECAPAALENAGVKMDVALEHKEICRAISERVRVAISGLEEEGVFVLSRCIYGGLDGSRHPMSEVLVFDNKTTNPESERLDAHWLDLRASRHTTMVTFALYVNRDLDESQVEELKREFESALKEQGLKSTH